MPGEDGCTLAFYRFGLDWLTDGADSPSGVGSIEISPDSYMPSDPSAEKEEIYTLDGSPVAKENATPGFYISRTPSSSRVIILR